jgi:tetratricopeptide (TPR) repeat protein
MVTFLSRRAWKKLKSLLQKPSSSTTLAEAHTSLASALHAMRQYQRSEREFKIAIELNPNYATAHHWYAILLTGKGKTEEAISEAKKAADLDPLSMQIRTFLAAAYEYAGRIDEAQRELENCTEVEPEFGPAHLWLAIVYVEKKMYEQAIREAEKSLVISPGVRYRSILGYVYGMCGRMEEAKKIRDELIQTSKTQFVSYTDIATVCTGMGLYDEALDWLEKGNDERLEVLPYVLNGTWYAPLRSLKRFQDLQKKIS